MNPMLLRPLAAACALLLARGALAARIVEESGRPVRAAIRELEERSGLVVTFEEGRDLDPGHLVDVTDEVRRGPARIRP